MTVTELLDTQLEKGTFDIYFEDKEGNEISGFDFDSAEVTGVSYKKIAILKIDN